MNFSTSDTSTPKLSLEGLATRFSVPVPVSAIAPPLVGSVEGVPRHILIPAATIAGLLVLWRASHV